MLMRYYQLLTEAQNYDGMFDALMKLLIAAPDTYFDDEPEFIAKHIRWARTTLKKSDRIVWYLRHFRVYMASNLEDRINAFWKLPNNEANPTPSTNSWIEQSERLVQRIYSEASKVGIDVRYWSNGTSSLQHELEHYLSLPIPNIQNYVFGNTSYHRVINQFTQWEDEWKVNRKKLFPHSEEEIVIDFGDGKMWVNLNRPYCNQEADAMGHCGNEPNQNTKDTILSFRTIVIEDGQKFWRPSLTFILDDDGYLTEMKGRANNKPDAKYHPYIVALLRNPIVKGITGGGYKPENNFALTDLDEETAEALIDEKPDLAGAEYLFNHYGLTPQTGDKIAAFLNETSQRYIEYDSEHNTIEIDYDPEMELRYSVDDFLGPDEWMRGWKYTSASDREYFDDALAEANSSYKKFVYYQSRSLSAEEKGKYGDHGQLDLFDPNVSSFDLESFIEDERGALERDDLDSDPELKALSEAIGYLYVQKEIDDYLAEIYQSHIRTGHLSDNKLIFNAHELQYMFEDLPLSGRMLESEIDQSDHYPDRYFYQELAERLDLEIPDNTDDAEIIYAAFIGKLIGQQTDVDLARAA